MSTPAAITELIVSHSLCIVAPGKYLQRVVLSTIGPLAPFNTVLRKRLSGETCEGQSISLYSVLEMLCTWKSRLVGYVDSQASDT